MDWLRISLLVLGVILIAGIWIAHRMRTRGRNPPPAPDLDDWGDDRAVHIRAHRDDPDFEPVLGKSVTDLDQLLEPEERPVRPSAPAPASSVRTATRAEPPGRVVTPRSASAVSPRASSGTASSAAPETPPDAITETAPEVPKQASPAPSPGPAAAPASKPSAESSSEPAAEDPPTHPQAGPAAKPDPKAWLKPPARPAPQPSVAERARGTFASALAGLKQRWARRKTSVPEPGAAVAPSAASTRSADHAEPLEEVSEPRVVGRNPMPRVAMREKILVLHVAAPRNRPFTGVALGAALSRAQLGLGAMSIYHYREAADPPDADPLFSVANMVAPGTLGDDDLADMTTPGVTLFLQLHACERPHRAFEVLLETAHVLARDLGGRVLDAQQSTATNQTLAHMREDMNQWLLRYRPDLLRRKASQ